MPKYGSADRIKQLEEAAGISQPTPPAQPVATPATPLTPYPLQGKTLKPGKLYNILDIPNKDLIDRSTKGSPAYSQAELKQGYRKMGKGLKK